MGKDETQHIEWKVGLARPVVLAIGAANEPTRFERLHDLLTLA